MLRHRIFNELSELFSPLTCLICQKSGSELCDRCEKLIVRFKSARHLPLSQQEKDTVLPIWPAAVASHELTKIILLAKEMNIRRARNYLAHLLVESYMRAEADQGNPGPISLIPIPSSLRANRQRGYKHSYELANALRTALLPHVKREVFVSDLLRVNRPVADQSGLGRAERIANLHGAYSVVNPRSALPQPQSGELTLYLMDDLMTTGSSLQEGFRALTEAGFRPSGALVAGASAA